MSGTPLGPDHDTETHVAESWRTRLSKHLRPLTDRFRRHYGAGPVHLIGLILTLIVTIYACLRVYDTDPANWQRYAVWFLGAAIVHDLVLAPLYLSADRGLRRLRAARPRQSARTVNYIRVPVVLSGLLFFVYGSAILERGEIAYRNASGLDHADYFQRWLIVTAALFAASALTYLVLRLRADRRP